MEQSVVKVCILEVFEVWRYHWRKPKRFLAPSQRVLELGRSFQRGRACRDYADVFVVICGDLQELGRILQPVDFIQYDALALKTVKEGFDILHARACPGQFAVKIFGIGDALA